LKKQEFIENQYFANTASVYVIEIHILLAYTETKYFINITRAQYVQVYQGWRTVVELDKKDVFAVENGEKEVMEENDMDTETIARALEFPFKYEIKDIMITIDLSTRN